MQAARRRGYDPRMSLRAPLLVSAVSSLVGLGLGLAAAPAAADVLSLRAELHAGGAGGAGVAGAGKDKAFSGNARGGTYGALVGAEILLLDAWIEHHQYNDGSLVGTWTQFMTGFDVDIDLGKPAPLPGAKKGAKPGRPKGFMEIGLGVGFGLGTDRQVDPPLNNAQVSDKGFLVEARFAAGYNLNRVMSIGVAVPVSYGYMFISGEGAVANEDENQYQSIQAALMFNLRFRLKAK